MPAPIWRGHPELATETGRPDQMSAKTGALVGAPAEWKGSPLPLCRTLQKRAVKKACGSDYTSRSNSVIYRPHCSAAECSLTAPQRTARSRNPASERAVAGSSRTPDSAPAR